MVEMRMRQQHPCDYLLPYVFQHFIKISTIDQPDRRGLRDLNNVGPRVENAIGNAGDSEHDVVTKKTRSLFDERPDNPPDDGIADAEDPFLRPVQVGVRSAAFKDAQRMERIMRRPLPLE